MNNREILKFIDDRLETNMILLANKELANKLGIELDIVADEVSKLVKIKEELDDIYGNLKINGRSVEK